MCFQYWIPPESWTRTVSHTRAPRCSQPVAICLVGAHNLLPYSRITSNPKFMQKLLRAAGRGSRRRVGPACSQPLVAPVLTTVSCWCSQPVAVLQDADPTGAHNLLSLLRITSNPKILKTLVRAAGRGSLRRVGPACSQPVVMPVLTTWWHVSCWCSQPVAAGTGLQVDELSPWYKSVNLPLVLTTCCRGAGRTPTGRRCTTRPCAATSAPCGYFNASTYPRI